MPIDIVDVDVTVEVGAIPEPTFNDVCVIGTAVDSPPERDFGEVALYQDSDQVGNDFGDDSDVHVASEAIQQMGADQWRAVVFEEITVESETVADGEEVEHTPIYGDADVEAEGDVSIEWTTGLPSEEDLGAGEAVINADTGQVATGDTDVTLDYSYIDWDFGAIPNDVDLVGFAETHLTRQHIGDLDSLVTWASGENNGVIAAYQDGREFDSDEDSLEANQDIGSYVPSGDLLTIAHKSQDDVASHVLGMAATKDPWISQLWAGDSGLPISTDFYRSALIGDPATPGTFEGGIEGGDQEEGQGATNVVIGVAGVQVLSNWQTTAGPGSDYQYFDIGRTEAFAVHQINRALESLRLNKEQIPFTRDGRGMIKSSLEETFDPYVGSVGDPFAEIDVRVPHHEDSEVDRENRIWGGIEVEGRLAGNVHQFSVELIMTA